MMQKKLTITIDEEIYNGLHRVIGPRKISGFLEDLARPHVLMPDLDAAYRLMSQDVEREVEALAWIEGTLGVEENEAW